MSTPTSLSGANWTVKINGKDLHEYGIIDFEIGHLSMPGIALRHIAVPRIHGAIGHGGQFNPRPIIITGQMFADAAATLRTDLDLLKVELASLRGAYFDEFSPIRLETSDLADRYMPCIYADELSALTALDQPTTGNLVNIRIPLVMLLPFSKAVDITYHTPSGTGPVFEVLNTGTAPCPVMIELAGVAVAPAFAISNMAFYAEFQRNLEATKITGETITGSCGAASLGAQFEPGDYGARYIQASTFTTSFSSVVNNPTEQTWVIALRPQFGINPGTDTYVLEFYIDANNTVYLVWDDSENKWTLVKVIGGASVVLAESVASAHASNDKMVLAFSFGPDGMKLYKDGIQVGINAGVTTGITGSSGTLYLGNQGASARPDAKYLRLIGYPFQLSDNDVRRISAKVEEERPVCVQKANSATIASGARVELDFEAYQATLYASNGDASNDTGNWTANEWPLLHPHQMCFYIPSGKTIGGVKIVHRNQYL